MSTLRLSFGHGTPPKAILRGLSPRADGRRPALLVSYVYLQYFWPVRDRLVFRDWSMDSGAFSAWRQEKRVDLGKYIARCHWTMENDPTCAEIIALDEIGDGEWSLKNANAMAAAGVPAMPVFHLGEPLEILQEYCRRWSKVGLGGIAHNRSTKETRAFLDLAFRECWPHRFHLFGRMGEDLILRYPFHSADSSSWLLGPCGFGRWTRFGALSVKGGDQDVRSEISQALDLEERAAETWATELQMLKLLDDGGKINVDLTRRREET